MNHVGFSDFEPPSQADQNRVTSPRVSEVGGVLRRFFGILAILFGLSIPGFGIDEEVANGRLRRQFLLLSCLMGGVLLKVGFDWVRSRIPGVPPPDESQEVP